MLSSSWRNEPQASAQLPKAADRPMSEAAGIVVTEMNTPMIVLDRASVSEITPTTPARAATMRENQLGVSIRFETGRIPNVYAAGASPAHRTTSDSSNAATTAGRTIEHVEMHRIAVWITGRLRMQRQIHHRGLGAKRWHEHGGDIGRADHTQMNHPLIVARMPFS